MTATDTPRPYTPDELAAVRPVIERHNAPTNPQRRLLATLDTGATTIVDTSTAVFRIALMQRNGWLRVELERERARAVLAERERDALRSALTDAVDAFEECSGDYAKELAADDLATWRALAGEMAR